VEDDVLDEKNTNNQDNFPQLISVKKLAELLHQRIKKIGVGTVWEKIDSRFKVPKEKGLSDFKPVQAAGTITEKAFFREFERLGKEGNTLEKMNFGIRGNPVLLMNIFKILDIKGYSDLIEIDFKETASSIDKVYSIDAKVDEIKTQLDKLSSDLYDNTRKRFRVPAIKVYDDFYNITVRIISILNDGYDFAFKDPDYAQKKLNEYQNGFKYNDTYLNTKRETILKGDCKFSETNSSKFKENSISTYKKKGYIYYMIKNIYGKYCTNNYKIATVMFLYNIFFEYYEYSSADSRIRQFLKCLSKISIFKILTLENEFLNNLSPLFIAYFYIILTRIFCKRILKNTKLTSTSEVDELLEKYLAIIKKQRKYKETFDDPVKEYIIKRIETIYALLQKTIDIVIENYESRSVALYDKYLNILKIIVNVFYEFFESKSNPGSTVIFGDISFNDVYNSDILYDNSYYSFSVCEIENLEKCYNSVSTELKNIKRNI
jgi:hypothetical protein